MPDRFHDKPFDQETLLKLDIFRGYTREWLPVFLSKQSHRHVNIFDFFAGPGRDAEGRKGSPLIILEETLKYAQSPTTSRVGGISVNLFFNDNDRRNYRQLQETLASLRDIQGVAIQVDNDNFVESFNKRLPILQSRDSANLVILDQYGLKQINEGIFISLSNCPTTDIIFFISSESIRRFIKEPSIQQHFRIPIERMKSSSHNDIHRLICDYYKSLIPSTKQYYLAPFSIKKDASGNIYGLIFGTSNLLGLFKFLQVCWDKDQVTGEANYNIDRDALREGQLSFLPEDNVIKKQDKFRTDVISDLKSKPRDNRELFRFCLENGFLPKHLKAILDELLREGHIHVDYPKSEKSPRRGTYYLSWDHYQEARPDAIVHYVGSDSDAK